jgi:hypothetical protein
MKKFIVSIILLTSPSWGAVALYQEPLIPEVSAQGQVNGVCYNCAMYGPDVPNTNGAALYVNLCVSPNPLTVVNVQNALLAAATNYAAANGFTIPSGSTLLPNPILR